MSYIELLNTLETIKEKYQHTTNCADDCPYFETCNVMSGYPCAMYDDLMFLLDEVKKIEGVEAD